MLSYMWKSAHCFFFFCFDYLKTRLDMFSQCTYQFDLHLFFSLIQLSECVFGIAIIKLIFFHQFRLTQKDISKINKTQQDKSNPTKPHTNNNNNIISSDSSISTSNSIYKLLPFVDRRWWRLTVCTLVADPMTTGVPVVELTCERRELAASSGCIMQIHESDFPGFSSSNLAC